MSFESWISLLQFGAKNDQFNQLHQKLQYNLVINVIVLPILIILIEILVGYDHLREPNHAWWVSLSSVRTSLFNKGKEFVKWFKDVQCTISSTEQWINEGSLRCSISVSVCFDTNYQHKICIKIWKNFIIMINIADTSRKVIKNQIFCYKHV